MDEQDTVDAQWSQLELEQQQRRQEELRQCTDRGRCWLPTDDLPSVQGLQVELIDWGNPF